MLNQQEIKKEIESRHAAREILRSEKNSNNFADSDFLAVYMMIGEAIDNYIESKFQSDKVLEGILKDIQGDIAGIRQRHGE